MIAYRIPDGDEAQEELKPQVTSSGGMANVAALSDGDVNTVALDLPVDTAPNAAWVQFDYGHPQTIQAATLASLNDAIGVFDHDSNAPPPFIEAGDDGVNFKRVADIPFSSLVQRTVSFSAVTARYFRIVYPRAVGRPAGARS